MPYPRPNLTTLQQLTLADILSSPLGTKGLLRFGALRILSLVQAKLSSLHYGYLDWIARQSVPFTATGEWLEAWAGLVGVVRKPAAAASGTAYLTGTVGVSVPAGTQLMRADGLVYATTAAVTLAGNGTGTAPMQAQTVGATGNADSGIALVLVTSIANVSSQASAEAAVTGGADQELDPALRGRMLVRYRAPPQGGDASDYLDWALAIPGVTRAWVNPNGAGAGTVVVYTMLDIANAQWNGFPQGSDGVATGETRDAAAQGDQLTAANAIYPVRPATARVYLCSPIDLPVAFAIAGLGTADAAANQALIVAALQDMFLELGNVGGTTNPATMLPWPPIDPSSWYAAIATAIGSNQFTVTGPSAPIQPGNGQLPTLDVANTKFAS